MRTGRSDAGTSGRARHARHFPPENATNDTWQYVRCNSISTDKTVFLSLLAGETRLCPDKNPMLRRTNAHQLPPGRGHCSTKARCSLCRRGAQRVGFAGGREVSDNERNNDLSCLVLLTGKVLFCLIVRVLSATAVYGRMCRTVSRPEKCRPCCER